MAYFEVNFEDWRIQGEFAVWELASIMRGIDPHAIHEVSVNENGDSPDLSNEIRAILAAIKDGQLHVGTLRATANDKTTVIAASANAWLRTKGLKHIARQLSTTVHPDDAPISKKNEIVERLRHVWKDVEKDIKRAQDNGLFEEAATPRSGYWYEGAVIAWGKTNGRLRDPAGDGTAILTKALRSGLKGV